MRAPTSFTTALERVGKRVRCDEWSYDEAVDDLEALLTKPEFSLFVRDIVRHWLRKQIHNWVIQQLSVSDTEEQAGQLALPFPDLPPHLEVSPGTFRHQRVMTAGDWRAAVVQARTKSDNATNYYERVQRAADRALALLGADDDLTLEDLDSLERAQS